MEMDGLVICASALPVVFRMGAFSLSHFSPIKSYGPQILCEEHKTTVKSAMVHSCNPRYLGIGD
jgi:hypothetical protein